HARTGPEWVAHRVSHCATQARLPGVSAGASRYRDAMPAPASPRKSAALKVAVIGAGIIGLSVALELRARGAEVVVYDAGVDLGAGATIRSAGMLGAAFEWAVEEDQRALAALARHAGMLWPDFAARVERLAGAGVEFSSEGALVVARTPGELEWIEG